MTDAPIRVLLADAPGERLERAGSALETRGIATVFLVTPDNGEELEVVPLFYADAIGSSREQGSLLQVSGRCRRRWLPLLQPLRAGTPAPALPPRRRSA